MQRFGNTKSTNTNTIQLSKPKVKNYRAFQATQIWKYQCLIMYSSTSMARREDAIRGSK